MYICIQYCNTANKSEYVHTYGLYVQCMYCMYKVCTAFKAYVLDIMYVYTHSKYIYCTVCKVHVMCA